MPVVEKGVGGIYDDIQQRKLLKHNESERAFFTKAVAGKLSLAKLSIRERNVCSAKKHTHIPKLKPIGPNA